MNVPPASPGADAPAVPRAAGPATTDGTDRAPRAAVPDDVRAAVPSSTRESAERTLELLDRLREELLAVTRRLDAFVARVTDEQHRRPR